MILTPIAPGELAEALHRFAAKLTLPEAGAAFREICATSAERAAGKVATEHRRTALAVAQKFGMTIQPDGTDCRFNWDGGALNGNTEAYVILHEVAHFLLAPLERRRLVEFGLGPGPDTVDRDAAARAATVSPLDRETDEAAASLLGIRWEARLGQPALASFLDQNWLEGLDRSAAGHFSGSVMKLNRRNLVGLVP